MESKNIQKQIESILLFKGQAVSFAELSKLLETPKEEIQKLLQGLIEEYKEKGIVIVSSESECELVTSAETSQLIEQLQKKELETELSNASLETLSIILYMGPIARSMIDFIRGVNSQFTIRTLLIRGLIEKDSKSKTPTYSVTLDTVKFLGLNKIEELPNYKEIKSELVEFIKQNSANES